MPHLPTLLVSEQQATPCFYLEQRFTGPFLTVAAMFPQSQHSQEIFDKPPIFKWNLGCLLTFFLSFVPGNSSLLHLGCDTKHHGDSQQISYVDDKPLLKK